MNGVTLSPSPVTFRAPFPGTFLPWVTDPSPAEIGAQPSGARPAAERRGQRALPGGRRAGRREGKERESRESGAGAASNA